MRTISALIVCLMLTTAANAQVYVQPPAVTVQPAPVVLQPQPVVVQPRPVYVQPPAGQWVPYPRLTNIGTSILGPRWVYRTSPQPPRQQQRDYRNDEQLSRLESLPDGTVLQTRNADERENTSPGYFNHLAILSDGWVIEAQQGCGVIQTSYQDFLARAYSQIRAFEPVNLEVGDYAGEVAETLIGLPYAPYHSSLLPGDQPLLMNMRGVNCIPVVRYSYRHASGECLRELRIPDEADVLVSRGILRQPVTIRGQQ